MVATCKQGPRYDAFTIHYLTPEHGHPSTSARWRWRVAGIGFRRHADDGEEFRRDCRLSDTSGDFSVLKPDPAGIGPGPLRHRGLPPGFCEAADERRSARR